MQFSSSPSHFVFPRNLSRILKCNMSLSMMYITQLPNKLQNQSINSHLSGPCVQFPTESCQVVQHVTTSLSGLLQHSPMQLLVFIKETLNYKSHTISTTGVGEHNIFNHSKSLEKNWFFSLSLTHTHTHTHTHTKLCLHIICLLSRTCYMFRLFIKSL